MTPPRTVTVRVPATTANLGPGFDALALALDLWNETTFSLNGEGVSVGITGEGWCSLPKDGDNLVARAAAHYCRETGRELPGGLSIQCRNHIPLGSGLGSSAAAALSGLAGAAALLGETPGADTLIGMAARLEGHADNAAAAALGGLVVSAPTAGGWIARRHDLPPLAAAVVLPRFSLPTRAARAALPERVPLADAAFNLGRVGLVIEAFRSGDLELLRSAMDDRLHQPYRLPLIPGAADALQAAARLGAPAALSGAGPSAIAFGAGDMGEVARAMQAAFERAGLESRSWLLDTCNRGLEIE